MNIKEIVAHEYALVQPDGETRERAKILNVDYKNNKVIVKLSDGEIREMDPQFIIKSFGRL